MNTNLKKNLQDLIDEYKANKIIFLGGVQADT